MEDEARCCCCCCCCCGREQAGLQRINSQKESRLQRWLTAVLLLSMVAAQASLITVVVGGKGHQVPDRQPMMQPASHSSGFSLEQDDWKNPSAMLTAPKGNNVNEEYLEWESDDGNAFVHGGFIYSGGNLTVPRKGIYRVFLQITYESMEDLKCDLDEDELRLTNRVFLHRDSYKNNVPLLSAVESVSCSVEQWSKSLYTAALFSLDANSRLRVTSSHPKLIVKTEYQVFFGAELLPQ